MRNLQHLFVIDPLPSLNVALDSSLRMMAALQAIGHATFVCEQRQLSWKSGRKSAAAFAQEIRFAGDATKYAVEAPASRELASFAAIHMRKDPPYDLDYIGTTWLLESAGPQTRIYNDPSALRRYNEKLAILLFPEDTRPALVSANPEELLAFVSSACSGDGILKPLTLFGGRGVVRLNLNEEGRDAVLRVLAAETEGGQKLRLIQPFENAVFAGEVRVFTAFGEQVAWCLKKPAAGNFLANTRAGATLSPYKPNATDIARTTKVARTLAKDGVALIGFDLIGGHISEINITSPRLLTAPGDARDHYEKLAALFAKDLAG